MKHKIFESLEVFINETISDIYVYADRAFCYKQNGVIFEAHRIDRETIEDFIQDFLSAEAYELFKQGIEQDISLEYKKFFCRVHIFLSQNMPVLFFRILPQSIRPIFDHKIFSGLREEMQNKKGLVLIVGATGSGKTTTAHSILDYFNVNFHKHIVCIEDPIEFRHMQQKSLFTFREVGRDTKSFESGIMSAMRQSPDIIFIGELRGKEAIKMALLASQTGHLVLATMHAKDSVSGLFRLLNNFDDKQNGSYEIAESLIGVIAQQKSEDCIFDFEIMLANPAIKNLIKEEKFNQIPSQIALSQNQGMQNFKN